MMNKNRNKNANNRPAGGQGGNSNITRSSPRSKGPMAEGVYNNSHFLHAAALQMGNNVQVKTKGGIVVEGIFRAFSEDFSIALEVPHHYPIGADNKKINVESVQENLIIKMCDIVSIQAKDVDLEYATRDTFATDTAISSRLNGGSLKTTGEKKLQPWEGDSNGDFSLELDMTQSNGWDANEMFSLNEKEHGIKTTFKDNLESYTVQIDKSNADDFKEKEKEAARIAAEIENNPVTRDRLDLENGDEEAAFAAVSRPDDNNEKTTPPPNNNSQKYTPGQQQQKQSNRQQQQQQPQERKIVPQGGKPVYSKSAPMQPQQGAVQQTINAGGFKTITINPPLPQQYQQPPPSHYNTTQNQQQQQQSQNENKNVNNNESNNNSNANNKPVQQQQQQQRPVRMINQMPIMSFSEPPPNLNQHMGKPPVMSVHMPPPHEGQQTVHVVPQQVMIPPPGALVVQQAVHPIHAAPQAQRPPRETLVRTRNEDIRNLRQFQNDFNLTQAPPQVVSQQQLQQPPPQVPTSQQDINSMIEIKSGQHHPTPSSTPHSIAAEKAQTPPSAATPSLISSSGNSSSNSNDTTPPSSNDKSALGAGKKFTLNPQAKPFTPRSPSTPTQSRPHTPQTPGPMAAQPAQQQAQPISQPQQIYYFLPPQRPTPPPITVRNKQQFHQFQVSQATGQPIFNPPVPPPTVMQAYHHPQQIPAVQPQTYQTSQLRMFDVQQQQHVTQYIVQQPPTSTTPSPGQPTVFHPGPQPSPAAGPPQAFQPQQYVMLMPPFPPQYVNQNQHNPQQLQVVMQPQQSAQHPQ